MATLTIKNITDQDLTPLRQKLQREGDRSQEGREQAAERMEARRKRVGPIGVQAADLVEEGRTARVAEILREGEGS